MPALKAARFPFLLLLLLVPMPSNWMEKIVTSLQWGAAESAYTLFRLAGVPIFRTGFNFELPLVGIEVARELAPFIPLVRCSSPVFWWVIYSCDPCGLRFA